MSALLVWLVIGLVAVVTVLLERRYRHPAAGAPLGPGWTRTGERFVDPETGLLTEVWFERASGERRYVAVADQP
ncbi:MULTISPECIES: hypothetical protein [Sphingomonas]|uniref:hypothetical protein n=1 Tax=Sphingomonas TaxID=13687 RepID=UPI000DEF3987|nr:MULTISPECIES: hypothetical protein [Sphingomonas]